MPAYYRCAFLADEATFIDSVARLLATQWPAMRYASRVSALRAHLARAKKDELPCHLLLFARDDEAEEEIVCGHCRLQPASENADGFSAAITSVVVDPARRGCGLGRKLLARAEEAAAAMGYGYLYLWTHDAQPFYLACGYSECEKVNLLRPSLVALGSAAVGKLEALMAQKMRAAANGNEEDGAGAASGGAASADEACVRADSTWFRKRLLELSAASQPLSLEELEASVRHALPSCAAHVSSGREHSALRGQHAAVDGVTTDERGAPSRDWEVRLAPATWERQVGPCCGLAALRMARSALRAPHAPPLASAATASAPRDVDLVDARQAPPPPPLPSPPSPPSVGPSFERVAPSGSSIELTLPADPDVDANASVLQAAIERGFSSDGEVFDIHHLATLAAEVCGLQATVLLLDEDADADATKAEPDRPATSAGDVNRAAGEVLGRSLTHWIAGGGVAVVPYDKDDAHHRPVLKGGHSAHYALVCGLATRDSGGDSIMAAHGDAGDVLLVCIHGLSRRPLVLTPSELAASNKQLLTMKRSANSKKWVVGSAGVRLARRVLLLR